MTFQEAQPFPIEEDPWQVPTVESVEPSDQAEQNIIQAFIANKNLSLEDVSTEGGLRERAGTALINAVTNPNELAEAIDRIQEFPTSSGENISADDVIALINNYAEGINVLPITLPSTYDLRDKVVSLVGRNLK